MTHEEVKNYFAKQPDLQRTTLGKVRELIIANCPSAIECMNYGVPAFKVGKRSFIYGAFREHLGIYPGPDVIEMFKDELKVYKTSKGAIQFPLDKPIPYDLIAKLIRYRFASLG